MKAQLRPSLEKDIPMRDVYAQTLVSLAEQNDKIALLEADLTSAIGTKPFFNKFPERAINCGIQEANMVGVSAGMSSVGMIPFAHTFGPFATRRVCDQLFMSGAYAGLNLKLMGSDPGIAATYNGGTHMPFEDMAIVRAIPEVKAFDPSDNVQFEFVLRAIAAEYGVHYVRFPRKGGIKVYTDDSQFELGKGVTMIDGTDVTIITSGAVMMPQALKAVQALLDEGISARLVDMFTWKPIDAELIEKCATETGAIVTAENHNIIGGLGSAVASVVVGTKPVPMEFVGVHDRFGQVGSEAYLAEEYGLTAKEIVAAAKKAISRK